jgi:hypothetical protein
MKLRTYTGLAAASALALTLAACGKKAEEAVPADTAVTPPVDSMAATPPADSMAATPPAGSMATTPPADSMMATPPTSGSMATTPPPATEVPPATPPAK